MIQSNFFINRVYKNSLIIATLLIIISFLLTRTPIYSIIIFFAAIIGVFGFFISIKTLDRLLKNKKGKPLIFFVFFLKLIIIAVSFYPVSRVSEKAVLFYIAGISVIVMSMMLEGFLQVFINKNNLNKG